MKKILFTMALLVSLTAVAQNEERVHRHQWGIGLSPNLFEMTGRNHYDYVGDYLMASYGGVGLPGVALSSVSRNHMAVMADYRYTLATRWVLEARLKLTYYKEKMLIMGVTSTGGLGQSPWTVTAVDLHLPVTANYRLCTIGGTTAEGMIGVGVRTMGLIGNSTGHITGGITNYEAGMYYEKPFNIFGVIGVQLDAPLGHMRIHPYFTWSVSPIKETNYYGVYPNPGSDMPMPIKQYVRMSDMEIGIMLCF